MGEEESGVRYVSIWRRRLYLVLAGVVLLVLAVLCALWVSWRPYQPPDGPVPPNTQYLAVLRNDIPRTDPALTPELEARRGKVILVLSARRDDDRAPQRYLPAVYEFSGQVLGGKSIPADWLDFDLDHVRATYPWRDHPVFDGHNLCDDSRAKRLDASAKPGAAFVWESAHGGTGRDGVWEVTIYGCEEGQVRTYFATGMAPVNAYRFIGSDLDGLICMYDDGVAGFRWDGSRYAADESYKHENVSAVLTTVVDGLYSILFLTSLPLAYLAGVFWIYRILKWFFLGVLRRRYRRCGSLRVLGTGAFLLVSWLFLLGLLFHNKHHHGAYITAVFLMFAAWQPIAWAAILPNRRLSVPGDDIPQMPQPPDPGEVASRMMLMNGILGGKK